MNNSIFSPSSRLLSSLQRLVIEFSSGQTSHTTPASLLASHIEQLDSQGVYSLQIQAATPSAPFLRVEDEIRVKNRLNSFYSIIQLLSLRNLMLQCFCSVLLSPLSVSVCYHTAKRLLKASSAISHFIHVQGTE